VEVPYFLSKYDPDPLCLYLTAIAPEKHNTEACPACPEHGRGKGTEGFSWEDFAERNNPVLSIAEGNELVATWGNLANRMLSFAYKRFEGKVPEPSPLGDQARALLEKAEAGFETMGELYNACKFRAAPSVPSGQAWARR
jgi:methionyl-tRNA synthetase